MDSTSQRNINYSAMHVMSNSNGAHQLLYLAVESTVNHSSQTQVDVLKNTLAHMCDTARHAPKAADSPSDVLTAGAIAQKIYGANGDHANDQIKVAALEKELKLNAWFECLGNEHLLKSSPEAGAEFFKSIRMAVEDTIGFDELSLDAQASLVDSEKARQIRSLGKQAYLDLTPEEQQDIGLFIHFGCCMHKDMNTVKGGVAGLQAYWVLPENGPGPVLLPNMDNDAVLTLASSSWPPTLAEQ